MTQSKKPGLQAVERLSHSYFFAIVKVHDRPRHPARGLTRWTSEGTSTALGLRPRTAELADVASIYRSLHEGFKPGPVPAKAWRRMFEYARLEEKPNLGFVLLDGAPLPKVRVRLLGLRSFADAAYSMVREHVLSHEAVQLQCHLCRAPQCAPVK